MDLTVKLFTRLCLFPVCQTMAFSFLQGRTLRAIMGEFPPSSAMKRNASGHIVGYSGGIFEEFNWVSDRLKFNYTITPAQPNTAGIKDNSSRWNGMIGSLVNKESDISLGPFAIALERFEAIEFAGFLGGDDGAMIVKYPSSEKSSYAALKPFSQETWFGFLCSTAVISLCCFFLAVLYKKTIGQGNERFTFSQITSNFILYMFITITMQGGNYQPTIRPIRLLAITWLLASFFFVYAYNSTLISYLSVNYKRPYISTFHDMVVKKDYKIAILKGSISEIDILTAPSGDLRILSDRLRKCSDCRITNVDDAVEKVLSGNYIAILATTLSKRLLLKYQSADGKCALTLGRDRTPWKPMYFGLPKKSVFMEEINREALWYVAHGINVYWRRRYGEREDCVLKYNSNGYETGTVNSPLKLKQFYFPFILLLVGYAISALQFLREKIL